MTYADLIEHLSTLTTDQLNQSVTIFVEGVGESYTALELSTKNDGDEDEIIVLVI